MAEIIENRKGRRMIKLTADDVISIVREYQRTAGCGKSYEETRQLLKKTDFYLPEDV